jgi:hypothetical protein
MFSVPRGGGRKNVGSSSERAIAREVTQLVTTSGQQLTGISDTVYDLTSVFYHAAQGGQVYAKYIEDAEREGDQELVDFFKEVQEQDAKRAQKAKSLLSKR